MAKIIKEVNISNSSPSKFIKNFYYLIFDDVPIVMALCEFDPTYYSDSLAIQILGIDLFNKISNAVNSRKAEFLAGRFLANNIIIKLGYSNAKVDISANRLPLWPDNIKGSISHTDGFAICGISSCKSVNRLGVDIELLDQEVPLDLIKTVMCKDEILLANLSGLNSSNIFLFFFSAKESLFKALYPEVKFFFDFDVAKIININIEEKTFYIALRYSLNSTHTKGMIYKGRYHLSDTHIVTIIH